jgi:beta-galactosidase
MRMRIRISLPTALFLTLVMAAPLGARADRLTLSLDGHWRIADTTGADAPPREFTHTVPVPGLANLAQPGFEKVDAFYSREHLANRIRAKLAPDEWLTNYWNGKVDQDRNYFWYQKSFRAPAARAVALLKINKAQFGTAVWLNGQKLGEYSGCFSAGYFHLEKALRWNEENTLLIRIGAHPAVLHDTYPTGSDFEKIKWTPGIYDSVSVIFCENPLIESIQVAPRVSASEILVQTRLKNCGASPVSTTLAHTIRAWKSGKRAAGSESQTVALAAGEERVVTETIRIPGARLWSPEDPFLYVLESSTGGDATKTRFGMREFQFDGPTRRAYLNGKVYYLRGSNITLHRFFEDPLCRDLPWNETWVRKLLGEIPKKMHWNYFRFCIGPVPDRWLDICDEEGLLIQNEFFIWTGAPGWYKGYSRTHDSEEMIRQYQDWMRDNWNHPSVAVWDANNETKDDSFGAKIIPAVRPLDLSNRPWENSYNPPVGPNDPVEDHPYLMISGGFGKLTFQMSDLEKMDGKPRTSLPSDKHAPIINEYGWLWLNRDGSPTRLTENLYPQLMGTTNVTARERLDLYSYLLAGKTEFWRAHRQYAGIIHFVYLTCSYPGVYTADHFKDVTRLKLDPAFADYMGEAFKPLGVYLNFFQPAIKAGSKRELSVFLVNDYDHPLEGRVVLSLESEKGKTLARVERPFSVASLGNSRIEIPFEIPNCAGKCVLKATALPEKASHIGRTTSRRWVKVEGN